MISIDSLTIPLTRSNSIYDLTWTLEWHVIDCYSHPVDEKTEAYQQSDSRTSINSN